MACVSAAGSPLVLGEEPASGDGGGTGAVVPDLRRVEMWAVGDHSDRRDVWGPQHLHSLVSRRCSFSARSIGFVGIELELYQVAVRVPHVEGVPQSPGAHDVLRPAFDLHAGLLEAFGKRTRGRTLYHKGEVIVTPSRDGFEVRVWPQMQDELGRYP